MKLSEIKKKEINDLTEIQKGIKNDFLKEGLLIDFYTKFEPNRLSEWFYEGVIAKAYNYRFDIIFYATEDLKLLNDDGFKVSKKELDDLSDEDLEKLYCEIGNGIQVLIYDKELQMYVTEDIVCYENPFRDSILPNEDLLLNSICGNIIEVFEAEKIQKIINNCPYYDYKNNEVDYTLKLWFEDGLFQNQEEIYDLELPVHFDYAINFYEINFNLNEIIESTNPVLTNVRNVLADVLALYVPVTNTTSRVDVLRYVENNVTTVEIY